MKQFGFLFLIIGILIIIVSISYANQDVKFELVLCEGVIRNLLKGITDTFHTGEKIYAYLYLDSIENRTHKIGFYWYNPNNKLQESYIREITVTEGAYNIWSWIKLKESEVLFDVSFLGRWNVKVYIDGKFLAEKYFNVI